MSETYWVVWAYTKPTMVNDGGWIASEKLRSHEAVRAEVSKNSPKPIKIVGTTSMDFSIDFFFGSEDD